MGIDLIGPMHCTDNNNKYILTLSDYCTKWVEAIALPSKHATEVALPLFKVRKSVLGFIVQLLFMWSLDIYENGNPSCTDI